MKKIFVYTKNGQAKVLSKKESKERDLELRENGWKHVAILDVKTFFTYLLEKTDEAKESLDNIMYYGTL